MLLVFKQKLARFFRSVFQNRPGTLVNTRHDFQLLQRLHGRRVPSALQLRFISRVFPRQERWLFFSTVAIFCLAISALLTGFLLEMRVLVPTVGGEYTEGVVGNPRLINPIFASANEAELGLVRLVYNGLTRLDQLGQPVTDLAESYTVSSDQKVYTFTLAPARWHDGQPVTAKDVVFTYTAIQDKSVLSPLQSAFAGVSVTSTDERTVQFSLTEAYPSFLQAVTVGIIPEHIWGSVARDQMHVSAINTKPIGTGPFQFDRLITDDAGIISRVEVSRFEEYFKKPAFLQKLVFQYYQDYEGEAGALEALRTQKVQGLSFVPIAYRDTAATKHVQLKTMQLPQYTALFFNLNQVTLQDRTVRESLRSAVNKTKILQDTLADEGAIIDSPILPGIPGYSPLLVTPVDIDGANAALDKNWSRVPVETYKKELIASFVKAHQTASTTSSTIDQAALEQEAEKLVAADLPPAQLFFRRAKDGKDLVIRLVTSDTPEYRQVAGYVAGHWQDIGVRTVITYVNPKDLARVALKNREYDVLLSGVIMGSDADLFPFWHSSQGKYPGLNVSNYSNRIVDDVLVKIRKTQAPAELEKLLLEFQTQLARDIPAIFLYNPNYLYGIGKDIKGFSVQKITHSADRFVNVTDWYSKTKSSFSF